MADGNKLALIRGLIEQILGVIQRAVNGQMVTDEQLAQAKAEYKEASAIFDALEAPAKAAADGTVPGEVEPVAADLEPRPPYIAAQSVAPVYPSHRSSSVPPVPSMPLHGAAPLLATSAAEFDAHRSVVEGKPISGQYRRPLSGHSRQQLAAKAGVIGPVEAGLVERGDDDENPLTSEELQDGPNEDERKINVPLTAPLPSDLRVDGAPQEDE